MPSIRIYQKKQIRLDRLSFRQNQMFKIGNVGVAAVKNWLAASQGPTDSAAKPLTKQYAIWKTKQGKGNRRNLTLTGDMLRNFLVRTVSENKAKASVTGRGSAKTTTNKRGKAVGAENKIKAWITNKIEPWIVFSAKNRTAVLDATNRILIENKSRLVVEKALGGKQL